MTCAGANIAQIRQLAKDADADTLREIVNILCDRLDLIAQEIAAKRVAVALAQQEIRGMAEQRRGAR